MRLNKLWKRFLAVTLSAALALGVPVAAGPKKAEAEAVPEPTYLYTFEGDSWESTGSKNGTGTEIKSVTNNGGTIEIIDGNGGKVLRVSDGEKEQFGQNYAKLPEGLFGEVDSDKGMTLSMRVNIAKDKNWGWSTIFSSTPSGYNEWNLFKVNANLVADVNGGDPQVFTGGSDQGIEHFGDWHLVTVTIDSKNLTLYLDETQKYQISNNNTANKDSVDLSPMLTQLSNNKAGTFPPEPLGKAC